jgi:hypothetical protein
MKIYLATWLSETSQGESLTRKKYKNRLLSFHFLQESEVTKKEFRTYARYGRVNLQKMRKQT